MKRSLAITFVVLTAAACAAVRQHGANPYEEPPFYAKYLNTGSSLDAQITRTLEGLRADATNAQLHNELGALLVQKGFPKDAEREFERAVNLDKRYYPAWYNLGMVRAARGDEGGSRRAFRYTVHYKPGHAMALFQLGLIEEKLQHSDRAVELYAKALSINPSLIEPSVNPRILDTKLVHRALIAMYGKDHARKSMQFQGVSGAPRRPPAAEAAPAPIVPPPAPQKKP